MVIPTTMVFVIRMKWLVARLQARAITTLPPLTQHHVLFRQDATRVQVQPFSMAM
jgi:hypothetical protein